MTDVFDGRVALVTGGSSGLGRAISAQLVARGCTVAILARDHARLERVRDELGSARVVALAADVTDPHAVADVLDGFRASHRLPDFLFNCAGAARPARLGDTTIADFEAAMRLNHLGTVIPTQHLLADLVARGRGHIINVASVAGFLGLIGYAAYAPSKAAVISYSEVLRHELKPHGLRVSVVCPPDFSSPGFAAENRSKPPECAALSAHASLMEAEAVAAATLAGVARGRFLILPGRAAPLYRATRLVPGLVRWFLDRELRRLRR